MFEMLLLFIFFGLVLWFLVPEERSKRSLPSYHSHHTADLKISENPSGDLPREQAERWINSGRR